MCAPNLVCAPPEFSVRSPADLVCAPNLVCALKNMWKYTVNERFLEFARLKLNARNLKFDARAPECFKTQKGVPGRDAVNSLPLFSPTPLALGPSTLPLDPATVLTNVNVCLNLTCAALCVS